MPRRIPPLNPLFTFEAAVRHGSLTRAAAELYVTQGAVSRQVKALEDHLGFPLFERQGSALRVTPASQAYAEELARAFEIISDATEKLVAHRSGTVLTLQAFNTFLARWLVPRLPAFHKAFPHIELRLVVAARPDALSRDTADIAIFHGRGDWPNYHSDLLFHDALTPVCSPRLLRGRHALRTPAELRHHTLLHLKHRATDWKSWLRTAELPNLAARQELHFEDLGIVYQCAAEGMGVAMGQLAYLEAELRSGALVAPFPIVLHRPHAGYYLVRQKYAVEPEKVTTFRTWLLDLLESERRRGKRRAASAAAGARPKQGARRARPAAGAGKRVEPT